MTLIVANGIHRFLRFNNHCIFSEIKDTVAFIGFLRFKGVKIEIPNLVKETHKVSNDANPTQVPVAVIEQAINYFRNKCEHNSLEIILDKDTKALIEDYSLMIFQRAVLIEASDMSEIGLATLNRYLEAIGKTPYSATKTESVSDQNEVAVETEQEKTDND